MMALLGAATLVLAAPAIASHPEVSLPGQRLRDRHRRQPQGRRPGAVDRLGKRE
jgi:hypothetical protein